VWAHAPLCGRLPLADDVAGFVCAHIEGVHTLTLRLIKEKIRGNLRPYPSTLGWARRIGRVFGLTSRIDIDYIFDLANRRGRDVFFLQVGANDGLMDDPIHFLVRKYGWCGVLLEPDPQLFERLKENYSGVDGPILVNAALSPINGKTTFYRIRMDEKMPSWCAGLGSFRRDVILSNKNDVPEIESHIVEDRIESISFHSLVARYKLPRIDLIVIDTEGYDLEILRQLDLIRFKPDLIVYEHKHLNELERTIAADLLIANGYSVQSTAWANTVAMRQR
jgi:FkbM family methyltransferase